MESATLELLTLLVARTSRLVLLVVAVYCAEKILSWPRRVDRAFDVIIVFGVWLQVGLWAATALRFFIERRQQRSGLSEGAAASTVNVLMFVGQLLIWAVIVLLALDNLGVNITALVAGLGVGGIAVALAVQTILGDVFGSLSIAFDKPFVVGDTLRIDDIEGTVEHIGIKSTRLRSVTGEQVILANADVLRARVRNLGRMPEKRFTIRLRLAYETPPALVERAPVLVEEAVRAGEGTRFVSCLLAQIGDYALEFEAVYFVANRPDRNIAYTNDLVNRGILQRFATAGISLAYPTRRQVN
jgi:small-conductance mechanosensitive channel